jgi:Protein of unknown function (DUF3035)
MRSKLILRLAVAGLGIVALSGCDTLRRDAGLTKQPPDEFAVTTKAPLIIPPDYKLLPPSPGAAPLNQSDPTSAAEAAMFNTTDLATVAAQMRGNYSPAEKMLLANAGVQNADPSIRAELQSDEKSMQGADTSFTDRILGSPAKRAPNDKSEDKGGGWFDWF